VPLYVSAPAQQIYLAPCVLPACRSSSSGSASLGDDDSKAGGKSIRQSLRKMVKKLRRVIRQQKRDENKLKRQNSRLSKEVKEIKSSFDRKVKDLRDSVSGLKDRFVVTERKIKSEVRNLPRGRRGRPGPPGEEGGGAW
jgi:hypothetical protein